MDTITEYVEDVCINAGVTARYQFKHEDSKGLLLNESYLAVSINGSEWFDANQIMRTKERIENGEILLSKQSIT
jgi:hypothetical protein